MPDQRSPTPIALLLLLLCVSCHTGLPAKPPVDPESQLPQIFSRSLESEAAFEAFSTQVAGERYTKFIIDLRSGETLFFDVNIYPMHVDFVMEEIHNAPRTYSAITAYNRNYEAEKPEFLLCYLVYHAELDRWTFSFWEGDQMTAAHVERAYDALQEDFYAGDQVAFRPDSTLHEAVAARLPARIPTITNDAIYRQERYHAFNTGTRTGRLRVVHDADEALTLTSDAIIVLTVPLIDLTAVSGIVSETFSTPLSHVALRARAWDIPHVGLRDASARYGHLEGEMVTMRATSEALELRPATPEEIAAFKDAQQAEREVRIPRADLSRRDLASLTELRREHTPAYGAKASNLGEITGLDDDLYEVPPGFGVPIAYYHEHLERAGLLPRVQALLDDPTLASDARARRDALAELRAAIQSAPVDPALLDAVMTAVSDLQLPEGGGVFVRSSTNAEDLPGFNGAGLYDTVPNVKPERARLADAIRQVWASVWNFRAFEERSYFGIDHAEVYGAVLIQVGVDPSAAGVLITANIFNPERTRDYTINAKSGLGIRVVEGTTIPEQLIYDTGNRGIKVMSRSDEETMLVFDPEGGVQAVPNPDPGAPVLTDARAHALAEAAMHIEVIFALDQPLDIEWLFVGDTLNIVQVRPYIGR